MEHDENVFSTPKQTRNAPGIRIEGDPARAERPSVWQPLLCCASIWSPPPPHCTLHRNHSLRTRTGGSLSPTTSLLRPPKAFILAEIVPRAGCITTPGHFCWPQPCRQPPLLLERTRAASAVSCDNTSSSPDKRSLHTCGSPRRHRRPLSHVADHNQATPAPKAQAPGPNGPRTWVLRYFLPSRAADHSNSNWYFVDKERK